jgi:hypothetical protein
MFIGTITVMIWIDPAETDPAESASRHFTGNAPRASAPVNTLITAAEGRSETRASGVEQAHCPGVHA